MGYTNSRRGLGLGFGYLGLTPTGLPGILAPRPMAPTAPAVPAGYVIDPKTNTIVPAPPAVPAGYVIDPRTNTIVPATTAPLVDYRNVPLAPAPAPPSMTAPAPIVAIQQQQTTQYMPPYGAPPAVWPARSLPTYPLPEATPPPDYADDPGAVPGGEFLFNEYSPGPGPLPEIREEPAASKLKRWTVPIGLGAAGLFVLYLVLRRRR